MVINVRKNMMEFSFNPAFIVIFRNFAAGYNSLVVYRATNLTLRFTPVNER